MHLRQKLSVREISRPKGVSQNTVTKHLVANTIEPKFRTPERASKLYPFAEKPAGWLKTEVVRLEINRVVVVKGKLFYGGQIYRSLKAGSLKKHRILSKQWRAPKPTTFSVLRKSLGKHLSKEIIKCLKGVSRDAIEQSHNRGAVYMPDYNTI
jgi:DNA-binding transcriptional ArsR family regulator